MRQNMNSRGQGRVWQGRSSNQDLMDRVFQVCNLRNMNAGRRLFAVNSFNRAVDWASMDRDNSFDNVVRNFRVIMGMR